MNAPLVSVVIPVYNMAGFIAGAVDSALKQSWRALEIIVVDDESSDSTAEALAPYLSRITYIRQKNAGAAAARNRGIRAARGEYVAFLDSDDVWLEEKIERQLGLFFAAPDIGACHTGARIIDAGGRVIEELPDEGFTQSGQILLPMLLWKSRVLLSSLMVRRECLLRTGEFDETLKTGEDTHFIMRCARLYGFGYLPGKLLLRRAHPDSLTNMAYSSMKNNATFLSLRKALELFPEIDAKTRRAAFEVRYFHYGYTNFRRGNFAFARMFFRKTLGYSFFNLRAHMFLILSFFPGIAARLIPARRWGGA